MLPVLLLFMLVFRSADADAATAAADNTPATAAEAVIVGVAKAAAAAGDDEVDGDSWLPPSIAIPTLPGRAAASLLNVDRESSATGAVVWLSGCCCWW